MILYYQLLRTILIPNLQTNFFWNFLNFETNFLSLKTSNLKRILDA